MQFRYNFWFIINSDLLSQLGMTYDKFLNIQADSGFAEALFRVNRLEQNKLLVPIGNNISFCGNLSNNDHVSFFSCLDYFCCPCSANRVKRIDT